MDKLLKKSIAWTIILVMAISIVLVGMHRFRWAFGLLTGTAWAILNFLLTVRLLKTAIQRISKAKLSLFLLVKFPLLYLTGFLILIRKIFPIWSLLAGLISILLVAGIINLWPKRT